MGAVDIDLCRDRGAALMPETFAPPLNPAKSYAVQTEPRVARVQLGDGYTQRFAVGLNSLKRRVQLVFGPAAVADIDQIEDFLSDQDGRVAFYYEIPGLTGTILWTCREWSRQFLDSGVAQITATLVEEFDELVTTFPAMVKLTGIASIQPVPSIYTAGIRDEANSRINFQGQASIGADYTMTLRGEGSLSAVSALAATATGGTGRPTGAATIIGEASLSVAVKATIKIAPTLAGSATLTASATVVSS